MDYPTHTPTLIDEEPAAAHGTASVDTIRRALTQHGHLTADAASIATATDLYAAGLTSHATVNVMLAIENDLDIEFPDELLTRSTFATIDALASAVDVASR